MHTLMVKTHLITGLKYLCYTRKTGKAFDEYLGSGTAWKRHLAEHGELVDTQIIFQTENAAEFKKFAIQKSIELDVVSSLEWANLKIEEGDGGDTVSRKIWVTDGNVDRYHNASEDIPEGWKRGRSRCVFNDPSKQKEFNARVNTKERGSKIKQAWDEGRFERDHSKCGKRGPENPACRPEVKAKISKALKKHARKSSERMKKLKPWLKSSRSNPQLNECNSKNP